MVATMEYIIFTYFLINAFYTGMLWQDRDSGESWLHYLLIFIIGGLFGLPFWIYYIFDEYLAEWLARTTQCKFWISYLRNEYDADIDTYIKKGEEKYVVALRMGYTDALAWAHFKYCIEVLKKRRDKLQCTKPK
jgi:hypothetical protein